MTMAATASMERAPMQSRVVGAAALGVAAVAVMAAGAGGPRQGALAIIGFAAGVSLYQASFGFTSAWRRMIVERRGVGLRAQLAMLAMAIVVFYPLLAMGSLFGLPLSGFVTPVGLALCLGAFIFGVGMQLGGGCGSGVLYTVGGGATRMMATLGAFIAGSLIATADPFAWTRWPSLGAYSIVDSLGAPLALVLVLATLAALAFLATQAERRAHGEVQALSWRGPFNLARGPWPLALGAVALALVNIATLVVAGRPWGITSAFALWGARIATATGVDVAAWPYWRGDPALDQSLFADVASVMNFGVMLGALAAAGLAGKFAPVWRVPLASLVAAILGGLMMGFGARLATGCNIGAFFSGVASGSAHGVVWLVFAAVGNVLGVRLRPLFALPK